jgi:hypothetical protein
LEDVPDGIDVYEVHPLAYYPNEAPGGRLFQVNVTDNYCNCHAFSAHHLCCHLLAASLLRGNAGEGEGTAVEELITAQCSLLRSEEIPHGDSMESHQNSVPFLVKRRNRKPVSAQEEEFGDAVGPTWGDESEIADLHRMCNTDTGTTADIALHTFAASKCDNIKKMVSQLPTSVVQVLAAKLEALETEVKGAIPRFHETRIAAQKKGRRKCLRTDVDRTHKTLDVTRRVKRKSHETAGSTTLDDVEEGGNRAFASRVTGRQSIRQRGLQNDGLQRYTKAGNKRTPRKKWASVEIGALDIEVVNRRARGNTGTVDRALARKSALMCSD